MELPVAFDGSAGAEAALQAAGRLALAAHARLLVLRVLNPLTDATDVVAPTTAAAMRTVVARERTALVERLGRLAPVAVEPLVEELAHGEDVADCVIRVAAQRGADMIVIASRRAAVLRGLVLGSVTQEVLRIAERPVLVVRA